MVDIGLELVTSRRAFPTAQELLAGSAHRRISSVVNVGWHGTETEEEDGAVAVVRAGGPFDDDLIGEVIRVIHGDESCFVYVLGGAVVPTDISLSRRAFASLAGLWKESIPTIIEVTS